MTASIEILPAQLEFIESTYTHTAYIGGLGSGKSFVGTAKTVMYKLKNPGLDVAYYLPTYQLIKQIAFPKFKNLLELAKVEYSLNMSDYEFTTKYGKIIMRSLTNYDMIIGYEVCYSCIDEVDVIPQDKMKEAFTKIIARNRLRTKDGLNITDMVGTPEGFGFAYNYFVKDNKPNRKLIKVKTKDNPYLPLSYIETLTETFTPAQLAAYLDGEFVNMTSGRVYSNFDRKLNHNGRSIKPNDVLHIGKIGRAHV
jgi:phage terminase large subunit